MSNQSAQWLAPRRGALVAFLAAAVPAAAPILAAAPASAQQAAPQDDPRAVLAQYGKFVQHAKYGEVWVPGVTPAGWHPYPACQWVRTPRFGWYFDDKTPWGAIVHHYGRWTNDAALGWVWVPGAEFSPGWVVWRSSQQYTGWAPTPPDADIGLVSTDAFNNGSQWTFMDTAKLMSGCSASAVVAGPQVPLVLNETRFVTEVQYIDGLAVFELPAWLVFPAVDIDVGFKPWPQYQFAQTILNWNWVWSHLTYTINLTNACGK